MEEVTASIYDDFFWLPKPKPFPVVRVAAVFIVVVVLLLHLSYGAGYSAALDDTNNNIFDKCVSVWGADRDQVDICYMMASSFTREVVR